MITLNPICFLLISFKYVMKYLSLSYKEPLDMLGRYCLLSAGTFSQGTLTVGITQGFLRA